VHVILSLRRIRDPTPNTGSGSFVVPPQDDNSLFIGPETYGTQY
jgi:hypothetical protein